MSLQKLLEECLGELDPLPLARQQEARWSTWLQPFSAETPAGTDPGYDDDFQRMREEVDKLSGADAEQVARLAETLLTQRCKDLRVATYYLWARLHKDGEAGLADGLTLIAALLERYPEQIFPARAHSRKMALEWLASAKVLASLALHPEVVKAEAERTAAALSWLENGLAGWPQDQRPALGALHSALVARLQQSGGVGAVVPQHSSGAEPVRTPALASAIQSGRDSLDTGRLLAAYLTEQPHGWLAAHRLMKSLRWDTLEQVPPLGANGHTHLTPPRSESLALLQRLHKQQNWAELLEQAQPLYVEGVNHFWLDLQWYLCLALSKQPAPRDGWADIVKRDLGMFLERLPGLEDLCWNDGTPFASEDCREWINQHVSGNRPQQWLPTPSAAPAQGDVLALEAEALALADRAGIDEALAWLSTRPEGRSGRERWLLRLLMARVAEQCGRNDLALHLLGELDASGERQGLAGWEPQLQFEVKARLLKLLRLKAQRKDANFIAITQRMDPLLAALVAIDPVAAAVLCG